MLVLATLYFYFYHGLALPADLVPHQAASGGGVIIGVRRVYCTCIYVFVLVYLYLYLNFYYGFALLPGMALASSDSVIMGGEIGVFVYSCKQILL